MLYVWSLFVHVSDAGVSFKMNVCVLKLITVGDSSVSGNHAVHVRIGVC